MAPKRLPIGFFRSLLTEKLPGDQIEHKLFGFFANQLHRHFV